MLLERIYHEGLAQAAYMVGCQAAGIALVVDPNRDVERYLAAAGRAGLRIAAVAETHIHADFVSGARELAQMAGARLYLSGAGPQEWQYEYAAAAGAALLCEGDTFAIGGVRVRAMHTPGHTPEHMALLVTDGAAADEPVGLLSGDCVFVGDVGRPDLLERAAGIAGTAEQAARDLFASLRRVAALPDYVQIWPGHGAGSACGKALGAMPQTTVGYERRVSWAFQITDETAFVRAALEGQPPPPPYFARMKRVNKSGPAPRPRELPPRLDPGDLGRAGARWLVVDTRPADAFAAGHAPGALSLPLGQSLIGWGGWLLPADRPLALIVEEEHLRAARDELLQIGLDDIAGFWEPGALDEWRASGGEPARFERRCSGELRRRVEDGAFVLDVRGRDEYARGHIPGSRNIPLAELPAWLASAPPIEGAIVCCQGGSRSPIAASLLCAYGWRGVSEMRDGYAGWQS